MHIYKERIVILFEALRCLREKWESQHRETKEVTEFLREAQTEYDKNKNKEEVT